MQSMETASTSECDNKESEFLRNLCLQLSEQQKQQQQQQGNASPKENMLPSVINMERDQFNFSRGDSKPQISPDSGNGETVTQTSSANSELCGMDDVEAKASDEALSSLSPASVSERTTQEAPSSGSATPQHEYLGGEGPGGQKSLSQQELEDEVNTLKRNCTILQHQLSMVMCALGVRPCNCAVCCEKAMQNRMEEESTRKDMINSIMMQQQQQQAKAAEQQAPPLQMRHAHLAAMLQQQAQQKATPTTQAPPTSQIPPLFMDQEMLMRELKKESMSEDPAALLQQILQQNPLAAAQMAGMQRELERQMDQTSQQMNGLQDSPQRGRRSKYCTAEEKKAVAEYAQIHGASAAARKFGIPPPVASYYQRKEQRQQQKMVQQQALMAAGLGNLNPQFGMTGLPNGQNQPGGQHSQQVPPSPGTPSFSQIVPPSPVAAITPQPVATPDLDTLEQFQKNAQNFTPSSTPTHNNEMVFKMMPSNPAHSGSPGFLRGRGRGRPKLIGDELDAELVEFIVKLKQQDANLHLTASKALEIARQYIMNKAPGLLEEHGGQVRLKITWAMKLVSRVAERQREMELGLPAGTLANLGRAALQQLPHMDGIAGPMGQMMNENFNQFLQQIQQQQQQQGQQESQGGQQQMQPESMPNFDALLKQLQQQQQQAQLEAQVQQQNHGYMPEIVNGKEIDLMAILGLSAGNNQEHQSGAAGTSIASSETGDCDDVTNEQQGSAASPAADMPNLQLAASQTPMDLTPSPETPMQTSQQTPQSHTFVFAS